MKKTELSLRGKSSQTWVNRTPPAKVYVPTSVKRIETVELRAWKLILAILIFCAWFIFVGLR